MRPLRVEPLDAESFARFGKVLGEPKGIAPTMEREDLRVWLGLANLEGLDPSGAVWAQLTVYRHKLPIKQLERHCRCSEVFIPLEGTSVIVVAPPSDLAVPDAKPNEEDLRAFLLDGSAGIIFPAGAWHWAPYPISEKASFLLLLDKDLDIDVREIGQRTLEL